MVTWRVHVVSLKVINITLRARCVFVSIFLQKLIYKTVFNYLRSVAVNQSMNRINEII